MTEKPEYTEQEKEFLEIAEFLIKHYKGIFTFKREVRKMKAESISSIGQMVDMIKQFAKSRLEVKRDEENSANKWKTDYFDVECTKCKFLTSLKAVKEEKGDNGYTFSVFECPKCHTRFRDKLPNNPDDGMRYARTFYDHLMKRGKNGKQNYHIMGIPKEEVIHLFQLYKNLKEADENDNRAAAIRKKSEKDIIAIVEGELVKMRAAKELILASKPKKGEG